MVSEINKNMYSFNPSSVLKTLEDFDSVLGLKITTHEIDRIPLNIRLLAIKRQNLKKNKKFEESDKLRNKINDLGYQIDDNQTFYTISKIKK
jgi:cysteinyl-tRNA synthetase